MGGWRRAAPIWRHAIELVGVQIRTKLVRGHGKAGSLGDINYPIRWNPFPLLNGLWLDRRIEKRGEGRLPAASGNCTPEGFIHGAHHTRVSCDMQQASLALQGASVPCSLSVMDTIHDRIRRRRVELGWSQAELGRRVGVSTQAVQQWEAEEPPRTAPRRATRKKVAEVMGVSLLWLDYGDDIPAYLFEEQAVKGLPIGVREPPPQSGLRSVPIIGFAIATPDEDGYFTDGEYPVGHGDGYLPWPTRDPNAYALRVKGDSMQPRIRPGELLIVEPNVRVSPGDDVVVRTTSGRKMVKRLLFKRPEEVTLGSINQAHFETTISLTEIESIQYVSAIVPRGANVKESKDPLEDTW